MSADDYAIDTSAADRATLRGVLRLESPDAYERIFAPIREKLRAGATYAIDLSDVVLMNSSGIRALGTLVLAAKKVGASLVLYGKAGVPWQKKTMASLQPIYPAGLRVELR